MADKKNEIRKERFTWKEGDVQIIPPKKKTTKKPTKGGTTKKK